MNKRITLSKIVLHIPHASNFGVFDKSIGKWAMHYDFINKVLNRWTDWYTDVLFRSHREEVQECAFGLSRFVCDVERLDNDPLEAIGQGSLYTTHSGFNRGILSENAKAYLLEQRRLFKKNLKSQVADNTLIIDCHSFPCDVDPTCDICIGYNDDATYSAEIVETIKQTFEAFGYRVKLNAPYANSITIDTDVDYKSVMIEVNKRVYMDESTLMLSTNSKQWTRWYECIEHMYDLLLNSCSSHPILR